MGDFNLTRASYLADFVVAPGLILAALATAVYAQALDAVMLPAAVVGYLAWTASEYFTHRVVFHHWYRREHWMHHLRPRANIGISPAYTVIAQVMLYGALVSSCGMAIGTGAFVGYAAGYLIYLTAHHWIHRWNIPPGHWLRPAFERHKLHHMGHETNFNVYVPGAFWDRLFGTFEHGG